MSCHKCTFHLEGETNPYARCLHFYNKPEAVQMLKKGLIGECDRYKPIEEADIPPNPTVERTYRNKRRWLINLPWGAAVRSPSRWA